RSLRCGRRCDLPIQGRNDPNARWMLRCWIGSLLPGSSFVSRKLTLVVTTVVMLVRMGLGAAAEDATTRIDIAKNGLGIHPGDFEFARRGEGDLGRWIVVRDPTAIKGFAIEHASTDQHEDRFPLAIYKPLSTENVAISVRLKIVSGTMLSAGLALSLR